VKGVNIPPGLQSVESVLKKKEKATVRGFGERKGLRFKSQGVMDDESIGEVELENKTT